MPGEMPAEASESQAAGRRQILALFYTMSAWGLLIAFAAVWCWGSLCWELGFGWLLAACCSFSNLAQLLPISVSAQCFPGAGT